MTSVADDQLDAPTPCPEMPVRTLLDHGDGLALAFVCAAAKTEPPGGSRPPAADASQLAADWRTRIPQRLSDLAVAWREPDAWTGMTKAGGIDLPGVGDTARRLGAATGRARLGAATLSRYLVRNASRDQVQRQRRDVSAAALPIVSASGG